MNVITSNNILVIGPNDTRDADIFLPLDGKSSNTQIVAFQQWANANKNAKLSVDGKFGRQTKAAWKKWGSEFDSSQGQTGGNIGGKIQTEPSDAEKKERAAKGQGWDKVKKAWVTVSQGAKDLGLVDVLLQKIGLGGNTGTPVGGDGGGGYQGGGGGGGIPKEDPDSKKMSTGMIIGLAAGGILLVGTIIYFANKNKK